MDVCTSSPPPSAAATFQSTPLAAFAANVTVTKPDNLGTSIGHYYERVVGSSFAALVSAARRDRG